MRAPYVLATALLIGLPVAAAQATPWLTDEQARDVAASAIHAAYPEPCYSTYRNERLESIVISVRRNPMVGNKLNNSVYFYRVASDTGEKRPEVFKEFALDEEIQPDSSRPVLFITLYRELVWGDSSDNEIRSLGQLRDLVQRNFQSAYSPYERDNVWQRKFERWWRRFQSRMSQLTLDTTYESTSEGTIIRGYAFNGFELTIPRTGPPPKGTPKLFQWTLLVKPGGTVERLPSKVIYSAR